MVKDMNNYLRTLLYSIIGAVLVLVLNLIFDLINPQSNIMLFVIILSVLSYGSLILMNIFLLDKIELGKTYFDKLVRVLKFNLIYLFLALIIIKLVKELFSSTVSGSFSLANVLAFIGVIDVIYIFVVTPLYIQLRESIKKLQWF